MRKWNAIVCLLLLALLVIHAVGGGFQLMGIIPGGGTTLTYLAWIMAALLVVHVVIGIKLTIDSVVAGRRSGRFYLRQNLEFWARRISGIAVMLLVVCHLLIFNVSSSGVYRLHVFEGAELTTQILLVIALLVHLLTNIRPLMISFGIGHLRIYVRDILFILAVLMLFAGIALFIYYLRWNVLWKS